MKIFLKYFQGPLFLIFFFLTENFTRIKADSFQPKCQACLLRVNQCNHTHLCPLSPRSLVPLVSPGDLGINSSPSLRPLQISVQRFSVFVGFVLGFFFGFFAPNFHVCCDLFFMFLLHVLALLCSWSFLLVFYTQSVDGFWTMTRRLVPDPRMSSAAFRSCLEQTGYTAKTAKVRQELRQGSNWPTFSDK